MNVWPPLPPDVYVRAPVDRPPFPLDQERHRLYAFGRQALWHGLTALPLGPGDEVLTPAWCHGSEVEALMQRGLEPRFYDIGSDAAPDADVLDGMIGPRTRALYLIHYLGFPQDGARWRRWCDERGLLLIEDAAQAWLATRDGVPVGTHGQLAIFCLYKTYPLPEGAALLCERPPEPLEHDPGAGVPDVLRRHAVWAAARSASFAELAARLRHTPVALPAPDEFHLRSLDSGPWSTTRYLLDRLATDDVAEGRRQNWRVLARECGDRLPDGFGELAPGASPFVFPVRTREKARLLARCAALGIKALDVWSAEHPRIGDGHARSAERRATTVGLPVHQELTVDHLDRIVRAVREDARPPAPPRLEPLASLDDAATDLDRLAVQARNLFGTREWLSTWWRHYGSDEALRAFAVRDATGATIGIVPAYLARSTPVRTLRFIGHDAGQDAALHRTWRR